ncbi:MAG TPA: transcriptional regulator, partial [Arthrobacter bacterium]|nr:transcriptional regulator [Arthrobacter sp.]
MRRLPWSRRMAAVASLGDEKRRQLFELIAASDAAVGRDDAAMALG